MASKRGYDHIEDGGAPPPSPKRARPSPDQDEYKTESQEPPPDASSPQFPRLQHVSFPVAIAALPHVLRLIDTMVMTPEEALVEATCTHQVEWVERLLQRFDDCSLEGAMIQAATNGYTDVVELLLEHTDGYNSDDDEVEFDDNTKKVVRKAVVVAAEHGHCDIVELLMALVMDFDRSRYSSAYYFTARSVLDAAAGNGHLEVVKSMVQHAHEYRYARRFAIWAPVDTLQHALAGGHLEVARFLIDDSNIFWNLKRGFVVAVEGGLTGAAERIADVFPSRFRGANLFARLAESGELDAVRYLFNHGCNDARSVGKALASAANGGRAAVVEFLLGTGLISSDAFDNAFKRACCGYGSAGVAKFLYNLKRATPKGLNRAFAVADDVATLKLLDENENISDLSVIAAFKNCTNRRFRGSDGFELLKFLASNACIPSELIDKALVAAAKDDQAEILDLLRRDSRVSDTAMGEAFVQAVVAGNPRVLEPMYEEQRVSPEALFEAFIEAAHRNEIDIVKAIVKMLSVRKRVPREFRCKALIAAARHGHMKIFKVVSEAEVEDWPLEVLKEAMNVAGGNLKIVNQLQTLVCDQVFKDMNKG